MSFFNKLFNHVLNQFLVDTLANSRTFQRFAVWSHKAGKELAEKSKEHSKVLDEHVSKFSSQARDVTSQLRKEFEQEMKKLQEQNVQQKQGKR